MWVTLSLCVALVYGGVAVKNEAKSSICPSIIDRSSLQIDETLEDTLIARGSQVILKCSATGAPQARFSWFRNGKPIQGDVVVDGMVEDALNRRQLAIGTVESRLFIPCFDAFSVGEYSCVAENDCSEKATSSAVLSLSSTNKSKQCKRGSAPLASIPIITSATVTRVELLGNAAQLRCNAVGNPLPEIRWERFGENGMMEDVGNDVRFMKLSTGDLLVMGDALHHQFTFRCTASNIYGTVHSDAAVIYVTDE